ncbi:MAG: hypothetical protein HWN66_04100 [Candidatus Helarchaeota archaeon]|nr:hypothetical protein [Candidatus Helarchaeota archaeon]
MKTEIEIIGEMLFATYYSKEKEERDKLTEDWNRTFLITIKEQGTLIVSIIDGEISIKVIEEGEEKPEVDFEMEADVETLTKFTVYSSYGIKDWFKRFGNILRRKVKFKPFRKIRDVIRMARIMGV